MNKKAAAVLDGLEEVALSRGNPYHNIPRAAAEFLYMLAKSISARNILEIGTSNGYSGTFLAGACQKLYTVESHERRFRKAAKNFRKAGLSRRIEQIKGHAPEVIKPLRIKFDLVFLDATKYEYASYLKTVLPKTVKGGLIIADNIDSHKTGLKEFFKETHKLKKVQKFYVPIGAGLLILKKL